MGVEFYTCNYCRETFYDCGGFVGCECGTNGVMTNVLKLMVIGNNGEYEERDGR